MLDACRINPVWKHTGQVLDLLPVQYIEATGCLWFPWGHVLIYLNLFRLAGCSRRLAKPKWAMQFKLPLPKYSDTGDITDVLRFIKSLGENNLTCFHLSDSLVNILNPIMMLPVVELAKQQSSSSVSLPITVFLYSEWVVWWFRVMRSLMVRM